MHTNYNSTTTIDYSNLEPGDIVFIYNNKTKYHMHVFVVAASECNGYKNRMHAGIKPWEYVCLAPPVPAERITANNQTAHVFHITDESVRKRFMQILESWQNWAVPFDAAKHDMAAIKLNEILQTGLTTESPDMTVVSDERQQCALEFARQQFDIEEALKYTLRREIAPVKIKEEKSRGMRCNMYVLAALQSAFLADSVPAVTTQWPSRKHGLFQYLLDDDKEKLTARIPKELRLSIRYCVPEILFQSICHSDALTARGELIFPPQEKLTDFQKIVDQSKANIDAGMQRREVFRNMLK